MKALLAKVKGALVLILKPKREVFLVRSLSGIALLIVFFWSFITYKLWFSHPKKSHSEVAAHDSHKKADEGEEHASEEHGGGGGHGGGHGEKKEEPVLFTSLIPEDILERQDGKPEPDHDLKEPNEVHRDIASLHKGELQINRGFHYSSIGNLSSVLKSTHNQQHMASIDFEFEVDSFAASEELASREVEMRSMLTSILATYEKSKVLSMQGKEDLKKEIMAEMNYRLKTGKVVDVLYSNFRIR
jgi:hypothetical protein